jgi:hypothetical protein
MNNSLLYSLNRKVDYQLVYANLELLNIKSFDLALNNYIFAHKTIYWKI